MKELLEMLTYKRPYDTHTEQAFVNRFILSLDGSKEDDFGNVFVKVGESETIFSSHTDTVHHSEGTQKITYMEDMMLVERSGDNDDALECLGADDAVGVWIMVEMIKRKVPGLYIFHRGEELGGIGSDFIACKTPERIRGYKRAVAFDRRGKHDVITHQFGGRCASDDFAEALSEELIGFGLQMYPSPKGVFTDTANYSEIIPECTNLSVGYEHEHTSNEMCDVGFAQELLDAVCEINWEALPTARDPDEDVGQGWENTFKSSGYTGGLADYNTLYDLCVFKPEVAASLLLDYGATHDDIEETFEQLEDADYQSAFNDDVEF